MNCRLSRAAGRALMVAFALAANAFPQQLRSAWASARVQPDGMSRPAEWPGVVSHAESHLGSVYFQNDAANLYVLIHLRADTQDDPPMPQAPWGDSAMLAFDLNADGMITPNLDRTYGFFPGTHRLGYQLYLGINSLTGLNPTRAVAGTRFYSPPGGGPAYRVWEFAIPLSELGRRPGDSFRFGMQVSSVNPAFSEMVPSDVYRDFSRLWPVQLAAAPAGSQASGGTLLTGRLMPDGSVEIPLPEGGYKIISPSGRVGYRDTSGTVRYPMANVQHGTPPPPPQDLSGRRWADYMNEALLDVMKAVVNDDALIGQYLQTEAGLTEFQRLEYRATTVANLIRR